jgi:hypothetical protein
VFLAAATVYHSEGVAIRSPIGLLDAVQQVAGGVRADRKLSQCPDDG